MATTTRTAETRANGRYQSLRPIGAGGMGIVYEAIDTWTRQRVALKLARPSRNGARHADDTLAREALAMALAGSEYTCSFYDLAQIRGRTCVVMERLEGRTLEARLAAGPLDTPELIDLAVQAATALAGIHKAGLVHQDIKPANIFITRSGDVKVLDFGLAVCIGAPSEGAMLAGRRSRPSLMGSPKYISPERILRHCADVRSDLFSLGTVLYEMATGRAPFEADTPAEILFAVLETSPVPVRSLAPGHPEGVDRIVRTLLARRPKDRYQSADALVRALQAQVATTVERPRRGAPPVRSRLDATLKWGSRVASMA